MSPLSRSNPFVRNLLAACLGLGTCFLVMSLLNGASFLVAGSIALQITIPSLAAFLVAYPLYVQLNAGLWQNLLTFVVGGSIFGLLASLVVSAPPELDLPFQHQPLVSVGLHAFTGLVYATFRYLFALRRQEQNA